MSLAISHLSRTAAASPALHFSHLPRLVLALRPNDFDARVQYARVLSWDRRYRDSARQYEKLLRQRPDRADLRYEYAEILSYDEQFVPAIEQFQAVTDLSKNPRNRLYGDVPARAYYNIGQIYRWYGWSDTALAQQNRAMMLDPGYYPARQEYDLLRHRRPASELDARYSYATDSNDFTLRRYTLDGEKWTSSRTALDLGVGRHRLQRSAGSSWDRPSRCRRRRRSGARPTAC